MNKKELIKEAYRHGMTDISKIAHRFDTSEKYVLKVIREAGIRPYDTRMLTVSAYIEAVKLGYTSLSYLSSYFNVSEKTITRFQNSTNIKKSLSQYFYLLNHRVTGFAVAPNPEQPTLKDVCDILQDVFDSIKPLASESYKVENNLKKILQIIEQIKRIKP